MSTPLEPTGPLAPSDEVNENAIELKDVEGLSQGQIVRRRFLAHRGALVGLTALALTMLLAYTSIGASASPDGGSTTTSRRGRSRTAGHRRCTSLASSAGPGSPWGSTRSARTRSAATSSPGS